ncbi:hypothetical protein ES288_D10G241500v1 [Gossypium darwinii]|uniref:RNase H type-1 domain-containing protein n=1 Tax=Gossypium darwinii TaxID=34276 RepID=A0A5D2B4I8_GOSDA|nr:hypothetical protein ES288_D10G241500v1 [Gossypium darwinii]
MGLEIHYGKEYFVEEGDKIKVWFVKVKFEIEDNQDKGNVSSLVWYCGKFQNDWWSWPVKCCVGGRSIRTRDLVWDPSPMGGIKFNVAGVVMNEIAACGGVLRDDKGVVSALFSGRCATGGLEMAVLMAIKEAAKMVTELSQKEQVPLIIKCNSITISDWLKYSRLRLWSFRNLFANIEGSLR